MAQGLSRSQENFTVEPNNIDPLNDYIGYNKIINLTTNYDGNKYILSIYPKTDCYDFDKSNDCLENVLVLGSRPERIPVKKTHKKGLDPGPQLFVLVP